jgi:hypothetical protein
MNPLESKGLEHTRRSSRFARQKAEAVPRLTNQVAGKGLPNPGDHTIFLRKSQAHKDHIRLSLTSTVSRFAPPLQGILECQHPVALRVA